jgi:hypothetical protein
VSTISNGPAPTIPSAPISPRSGFNDPFDLEQFSYSDFAQMASPKSSPAKASSSMSHYSKPTQQTQQPPRSASALGSLDMRPAERPMNTQTTYRPGSASAPRTPSSPHGTLSPLNPPVDPALATGRKSPSFGTPKEDHDQVKPFVDGANYPA